MLGDGAEMLGFPGVGASLLVVDRRRYVMQEMEEVVEALQVLAPPSGLVDTLPVALVEMGAPAGQSQRCGEDAKGPRGAVSREA